MPHAPLPRLASALLASALVACLLAVSLDLLRLAVGAALASRALDRLGSGTLVLQSYLTALWAMAISALVVVGWQLLTVGLARWLQARATRWASSPERWLALAVGLTSLPLWLAASWSLLSGRWIARALPSVWPRISLALLLAAATVVFVALWWGSVESFVRRHPRVAAALALLVLLGMATADALLFVGTYPLFHALLALAAGLLLQRLCWREPSAVAGRPHLLGGVALVAVAVFLPSWPWLAPADQDPLARFVVARFMPLASPALRTVSRIQRLLQSSSLHPARRRALRQAPALAGMRRVLGVSPDNRWPDVLLLSIDGLSPYRASIAGRSISGRDTTPFLRELARRGLDFRRAYAPSPGTLATFLSLLSGNWQREATQRAPAQDRLLARFRQLGYRTYCNLPLFDELRLKLGGTLRCDVMVTLAHAAWSADGLLHFVSIQPREQPVFAMVHFTATHLPYERFSGLDFGNGTEARYDAALTGVDRLLRRTIERLERRGRPLRLVVTADHGHGLGWHGHFGHNRGLYEDQLHVPLLLVGFPGGAATITAPVSLLDLVGSFAGGVGADLFAARTPGWQRSPAHPLIALHHHAKAIVDGRDKLIEDEQSGALELYDVVADPRETTNRIARAPALAARLRQRLRAAVGR